MSPRVDLQRLSLSACKRLQRRDFERRRRESGKQRRVGRTPGAGGGLEGRCNDKGLEQGGVGGGGA